MSRRTDEIEPIRDSIATVLADLCDSRALHAFIDGEGDLAGMLQRNAAGLGWLAIGLPAAAGGFDLGAPGLTVLHRELGRVAAPGDLLAQGTALDLLARADLPATSDLVAAGLTGTVRFAIPACLATADPGALLLGDPAAGFALVPQGGRDLALVALAAGERTPEDFWDRTRTLFTAEPGAVVALLPGARPVLEALVAVALAADSVGLAEGIAARTLDYMKGREQFGKPIAGFQALKHRMADIALALATGGHLVDQAAAALATDPFEPDLWPLLAKAGATEMAARVAADCVQLHGGVGFTWDYDPHLYLKRARLNEMLLGRSGVLRDRAFAAMERAVLAGHDVMELALDH